MTRSDEAEFWFNAVYEAIQQIPYGRVTSYGHIAFLLGRRESAPWVVSPASVAVDPIIDPENSGPSKVGICLKHLPAQSAEHFFHDGNVPWQRVINSKGGISPRGVGGAARQATALRAENVQVDVGPLGEFSVDFGEYGWFPDHLPNEEAPSEEAGEQGR